MFRTLRRRLGLKTPPVVSVLRLSGVIAPSSGFRSGLNIETMAEPIERAFAPKGQSAVALVINSPGGSPTQSALIAGRIRDHAAEAKVPVLAFVEDYAASGGYWLACAADEIFVQPSSIVGSVGVIVATFGFPELIRRWGIERRLYTAGQRKSLLDPFLPVDPQDVTQLQQLQAGLHEQFKDWVRARRDGRLKSDEGTLFSGEFWLGIQALELGLVDGIGDVRSVLRQRFGSNVQLRPVTESRPWLARRLGLSTAAAAHDFGGGMAGGMLDVLDQQARRDGLGG
jgi:signal peptide peptidase SppA